MYMLQHVVHAKLKTVIIPTTLKEEEEEDDTENLTL